MPRLNNRLLYSLLLLGILTACKQKDTQVETPLQFVEVLVRFLAPENQYKAQIMFFEGDSLENAQPVQQFSGVSFQNQPMEEKVLDASMFRYERLQTGPYKSRQVFEFSEESGKKQQISIAMDPIVRFAIDTQLYQSKGGSLQLEDSGLEAGETLLLLLSDANGNTYSIEKAGPLAKIISLTPSDLQPVPAGTYELYLVKKQIREIKTANRIVFSTIEYYSALKTVQVLP